MAIDPSRSTPSDTASISSLQSMTEESARAAMRAPVDESWGDARRSLGTNIIGGIGQALGGGAGGFFKPISDGIQPVYDAQHDLQDRTDLLEGVQAYCHAYMSKNINAQWSTNNWRDLPFNAQVGPAKGARIVNQGITLGSKGLWLIFAKIHGRSTSFTGTGAITMRIRVLTPSGTTFSESIVRGTTLVEAGAVTSNFSNGSLVTTMPVVVPGPDYRVLVSAWTAAWRWWDGGTQLSSLSVLKQSEDTINHGQGTVPDETESEAGA